MVGFVEVYSSALTGFICGARSWNNENVSMTLEYESHNLVREVFWWFLLGLGVGCGAAQERRFERNC